MRGGQRKNFIAGQRKTWPCSCWTAHDLGRVRCSCFLRVGQRKNFIAGQRKTWPCSRWTAQDLGRLVLRRGLLRLSRVSGLRNGYWFLFRNGYLLLNNGPFQNDDGPATVRLPVSKRTTTRFETDGYLFRNGYLVPVSKRVARWPVSKRWPTPPWNGYPFRFETALGTRFHGGLFRNDHFETATHFETAARFDSRFETGGPF